DLLEERPVEEVEIADEIVTSRLDAELARARHEIGDPRIDGMVDAATPRLRKEQLDAGAGAVHRDDTPATLGKVNRVSSSAAREVERKAGRHLADGLGQGSRRLEAVSLRTPRVAFVPADKAIVGAGHDS